MGSNEMSDQKQFLLDLANVLEKHHVSIVSREKGDYSYIVFQKVSGKPQRTIDMSTERNHVTAYDLRCQSGMSCKEANDLYHTNKEAKIPKCCVCGTKEDLHKDGWYGYRCDSKDCMCF